MPPAIQIRIQVSAVALGWVTGSAAMRERGSSEARVARPAAPHASHEVAAREGLVDYWHCISHWAANFPEAVFPGCAEYGNPGLCSRRLLQSVKTENASHSHAWMMRSVFGLGILKGCGQQSPGFERSEYPGKLAPVGYRHQNRKLARMLPHQLKLRQHEYHPQQIRQRIRRRTGPDDRPGDHKLFGRRLAG